MQSRSAMSKSPFQNFIVRFAANQTVFEEGDVGTTMFIVQVGRVGLLRVVDGERHDLGVMEKGDFFGEMSILEGLPRVSSAEALEDCELIEINSTTFDKMIKGNIEIAVRMLRKLSIRLRSAERRIGELQSSSAATAAAATASTVSGQGSTEKNADSGLRLVSEDGGVVFSLDDAETMIGRYDPVTKLMPDVDLTEVDPKRSVSRRHARIVRRDDEFVIIEEIGALNGTFVKGAKLITGQAQQIQDGDDVAVGMVKMVFRT